MRSFNGPDMVLFLDDALVQSEDVWELLNSYPITVLIPFPVIPANSLLPRMSLGEAKVRGTVINHGFNHDCFVSMNVITQLMDIFRAALWLQRNGVGSGARTLAVPQSNLKFFTRIVLRAFGFKIYVGEKKRFLAISRFPVYGDKVYKECPWDVSHKRSILLYTHDVVPNPSDYGCTLESLKSLLNTIFKY